LLLTRRARAITQILVAICRVPALAVAAVSSAKKAEVHLSLSCDTAGPPIGARTPYQQIAHIRPAVENDLSNKKAQTDARLNPNPHCDFRRVRKKIYTVPAQVENGLFFSIKTTTY
jgi:hypothetical protein